MEKAKAVLEGARRVAQNTPIQLEAARATEQQATARYRAGLGNIVEVAEAQRLLTQAEIDDSLARLGIWRALLGLAAVEGDLTPFLAAAGMTASVKSQAMMQRMIAAAIRQESARVAHDNTIRKRNAMFGAQFRNDMQTIFKK